LAIAVLLVAQLLQGFFIAPTMHAQDDTVNTSIDVPSETNTDSTETTSDGSDDALNAAEENASSETSETGEQTEVVLDEPEQQEAEAAPMALSLAATPVITDNLITSVNMYDDIPTYDGNGGVVPQGNLINDDIRPDVRPNIKDKVAVVFTWAFPNDTHAYGDGSTYTFHVSDKFKIGSQLKGNLDGGVGEYVVDPDGTVTFTFNELLQGAQLEGSFFVWISYDESKMDDGLKQNIDFSTVGQGVIPVHFANTAVDKLTKSGKANQTFNPDYITWTVDFNQSENEIKNAVLKDELPSDLELTGDIEIYSLIPQLDGSVKVGSQIKTENQFPISLGDINQSYRVIYTTKVKAPTAIPFTNRNYTNTVKLDGTDFTEQTDVGQVTVSFNEPLNKQNTNYDSETQTITWKVQYNFNQQSLEQDNAWIEDRFDTAKQKLVEDSVKVTQVQINPDGSVGSSTVVDPSQYSLLGVEDGFPDGYKLQFNTAIDKAYEIEYQTQSINRVYANDTITNTVKMAGDIEKTAKQDIAEVIFSKTKSGEDFNKKEIEWTLVLNSDLEDMTDILIKDDYEGMNMKLIPDSLVISGTNKDDFELISNPDKSGDSDYSKGFALRLKGGVTLSSKHTITYKTSFDPTAGMPTGNVYRNTAKLDWKEDGVSQTAITKSASVTPQDYTVQNGNKRGDYSAKDKQITWTIDVNYNLYDIQEAIVKDAYTGDQSFVADSLQVNELELQGANNTISVGQAVTVNDGQFKLNADGKGFELNLGAMGKKAYRIVYKTSLDGEYDVKGTYSNSATLNDGENGPQRFAKSANVIPAYGGEYVSKTGQQIGTSDTASWKVNVNRSQSYIAAGTPLTDTLSDNQILLADSLKLYHTNLPADNTGNVSKAGEVSKSDYDLVVDGNTFTITFKHAINTAYILEYQSFINTDSGKRIGNEVQFAGKSSSVIGTDREQGIKVELAGAGGGASSGTGKIKIKKVDDLGEPLQGAEFAIYNASGTILIETLKPTDEHGETSTTRTYRYHDENGIAYKLKEISAPSGYLVDAEYGALTGKTIAFKDPDQPFIIENKIIRQGFELKKVDSVDASKKLEGAVFGLYLKNGTDRTKIGDDLTTDVNGRIARGDLDPGEYELVEIQAPKYYQLDATPIPFTIASNQTQIVSLEQKNVMGAGGKLIVKKVNAKDQSALSGIEFELRDGADHVIARETTDSNGIVEFANLAYGPYTLVETKADGFVIEQPETLVEITESETTVTIENKENDRSVKLIKYNADKTRYLEGAVFELRAQSETMDASGEWEYHAVTGIDNAKLTTDQHGAIVLEGLQAGKYQLVEVKAPAGYVLDQKPVDFEITTTQTEPVLVEKTNRLITIPSWPSEPGTPSTPSPGTTTPSTPGPETPTPGKPTPEPSKPGVSVPGTVVTEGEDTSKPTDVNNTDDTTDSGVTPNVPEGNGGSDNKPAPSVPQQNGGGGTGNDTTLVGDAGDQANPGKGSVSPSGDTNVAGANDAVKAGETANGASQGMLPKTGEESTLGYTLVGALMMLCGAVGYVVFRRRQAMKM